MSEIEWGEVSSKKMIKGSEDSFQFHWETKYSFQIGLKDLDFDVNDGMAKIMGVTLPFRNISQAEEALRNRVIMPTKFIENDNTEHFVMVFDHRTVRYSGFMDCVTHSLTLTNLGLFEVGRFPGINLNEQNRQWYWFLNRRLATADEVRDWCDSQQYNPEQFMEEAYLAMIG